MLKQVGKGEHDNFVVSDNEITWLLIVIVLTGRKREPNNYSANSLTTSSTSTEMIHYGYNYMAGDGKISPELLCDGARVISYIILLINDIVCMVINLFFFGQVQIPCLCGNPLPSFLKTYSTRYSHVVPTIVLTAPDGAWLRKSDEIRYFPHSMAVNLVINLVIDYVVGVEKWCWCLRVNYDNLIANYQKI